MYKEYVKYNKEKEQELGINVGFRVCGVSNCCESAIGYMRYEVKHPLHGHGVECIRLSKRCKKHFKK
tara:strand:- start:249 stop:449 length:201 start_codon:yes stop_codon:yes gene_type:complete